MKKVPLRQAIPLICASLRITQNELASRCQVDEVTVSNWVTGKAGSVKRLSTRHLLRAQARQAGITIEGLE